MYRRVGIDKRQGCRISAEALIDTPEKRHADTLSLCVALVQLRR